jgi:putative oxidoreductase
MAVAYCLRHAPQGVWPILNRGELAALYSFLWLYFAASGAGPWSLDALLGKRSRRSAVMP